MCVCVILCVNIKWSQIYLWNKIWSVESCNMRDRIIHKKEGNKSERVGGKLRLETRSRNLGEWTSYIMFAIVNHKSMLKQVYFSLYIYISDIYIYCARMCVCVWRRTQVSSTEHRRNALFDTSACAVWRCVWCVMSRVAYVTLKRSAKQAEIFFLLEEPEKLYILSLLPSTAFNA